jgi:hypothetical protein
MLQSIVCSMSAAGLDVALIARLTGLAEEDVTALEANR